MLTGAAENAPVQAVPGLSVTVAARHQWSVLPSAAILLDLQPGAAMFLRYQQGFRPGGLAVDDQYVRRFDSDRVATIEAGYRLRGAARDPFAFSLTIAHTDWRDIQADFLDGGNLPSTTNVGDGDIWTVEAAATVRPSPGWRIEVRVSANHSSYN